MQLFLHSRCLVDRIARSNNGHAFYAPSFFGLRGGPSSFRSLDRKQYDRVQNLNILRSAPYATNHEVLTRKNRSKCNEYS